MRAREPSFSSSALSHFFRKRPARFGMPCQFSTGQLPPSASALGQPAFFWRDTGASLARLLLFFQRAHSSECEQRDFLYLGVMAMRLLLLQRELQGFRLKSSRARLPMCVRASKPLTDVCAAHCTCMHASNLIVLGEKAVGRGNNYTQKNDQPVLGCISSWEKTPAVKRHSSCRGMKQCFGRNHLLTNQNANPPARREFYACMQEYRASVMEECYSEMIFFRFHLID